MKIITVTPFRTDLNMPTGVSDFSDAYQEILNNLHNALTKQAHCINESSAYHITVAYPDGRGAEDSANGTEGCRYLNHKKDNKDIRLAVIRVFYGKEEANPEKAAVISIYNNTISIAKVPFEIELPEPCDDPNDDQVIHIRESALRHTRELLVFIHYNLLQPAFQTVVSESIKNGIGLRRFLPKRFRDESGLHFEPVGEFLGLDDLNRIVANERKELPTDDNDVTIDFRTLNLAGEMPKDRACLSKRETLFDRRMLWPTFTLVLDRNELERQDRQELVREWLANTIRPEDADTIIRKEVRGNDRVRLDYSFTWLNYLYVAKSSAEDSTPLVDERMTLLFDALHLAQYFYAAHDICARNLQRALTAAFTQKRTRQAEDILKTLSSRTHCNLIQLNELRLELTREKKVVFDDIMTGWEHEELFENGQRMISLTRQRLDDLDGKRQESSSFLTDIILSFIALISIFDLSIGLSGYSREIMAQPAMLYEDADYPGTLRAIAHLDIDHVFVGSALLVVALLILYIYVKKR